MLDIRWIRDNREALDRALETRGEGPQADRLVALDDARRAVIAKAQEAQTARNAASKEIGKAKGSGDEARAAQLIAEVAKLKDDAQRLEAEEREAVKALEDALATIPNLPLDDVPVGPDESANKEIRRHGEPRRDNAAKEHFELGEALGQMDFETAAKMSGSRFVVLRKGLARLERAIGQFMLDLHVTEHGYEEVQPPLLVKDEALFGTGQLPKFRDDQFPAYKGISWGDQYAANLEETKRLVAQATAEDTGKRFTPAIPDGPVYERYWLIPTAEVPLTNLVRESILAEGELPLRFTALTPCFRSEAGSAGKDTRGMIRHHQFYKVELVSITTPDASAAEHERMTECAETVLKKLGVAFRTVVLSTGDMGFGARKTFDIEVWLPGQRQYREISSCSVCGDFQARRMNARYRPEGGKGTEYVHTLNGSGVAVGRALIAVMETYQQADGSIAVPDALKPYMGGIEVVGA